MGCLLFFQLKSVQVGAQVQSIKVTSQGANELQHCCDKSQQEHRAACWPEFIKVKEAGKKCQWRDEKVFVNGKQHIPPMESALAQTTVVIRCLVCNGGLGQRGKDDALKELFDNCDVYVVCFTETHCLPNTDCIHWPGFVCFSASCFKIASKSAGGIAMYVTHSLSKHCKVWKCASDSSYMWVKHR